MEIYKLFNVSENLITTVGEYVFKFLAERNITDVTIGRGNEHELHLDRPEYGKKCLEWLEKVQSSIKIGKMKQ